MTSLQRLEELAPPEIVGTCLECDGPIFLSLRKVGGKHVTKKVLTPEGSYESAAEAADAHGITKFAVRTRCRKGSFGWRYSHSSTVHEGPPIYARVVKKFCTEKCRHTWHFRNDDQSDKRSRSWTRVQFALQVLKFMEKQFPEQTARMREGFEKKRREKDD